MLGELIRSTRKLDEQTLVSPADIPNLPFRTLDQFMEFDQKLKPDEHLNQYLVGFAG